MSENRPSNDRPAHWDAVYAARTPEEVSWHQDTPDSSLQLIEHTGVGKEAAIIDVGGGASRLCDHLLDRGYTNLTVLDVSAAALERAKERLGERAADVAWRVADVTEVELSGHYEVWHDRAAFHFLIDERGRTAYRDRLFESVLPGGHAIIATFSIHGPTTCSGLPVVRYSPATLQEVLGPGLELVETWDEEHVTPNGGTQAFVFCRFRVGSP